MPFIILALLYLAFSMEVPAWAQNDTWKLQVDKNGVQVFTRKVEGFPVKEFKGITIIDVQPSEILSVLVEISRYTEWVHKCKSSLLLEKSNLNEYVVHIEIKVPFPATDRDLVQRMTVKTNPDGSINLDIVAVPEYLSEQKGVVRMPKSDGGWTLIPDGKGSTQVTMQFLSDPGGSIPNWAVNMMLNENPYHTLKNLRSMVRR